MSYEHGTPFLNLPQTTGDDKRDWFDTNAAFLELDSKLKAAYEGSIDTADALAALTEVVSGISTNVETLDSTVSEHTTSISTINEALTLINSALTSLNTSVQGKFDSAGIADPYDAEHGIYDVGDVVTHNGQRYECVTAVTAAEPFDADKWNAVDVQTKLDVINTALSGLRKEKFLHNLSIGNVEQGVMVSSYTESVIKSLAGLTVDDTIEDVQVTNLNGDYGTDTLGTSSCYNTVTKCLYFTPQITQNNTYMDLIVFYR